MKELMSKAGYKLVRYLGEGEAVFRDLSTGKLEIWFSNKNHASYGFHYNNTDWEFAREGSI